MAIKKLPEHMINRLKAGEVVERPASVVKELLENSLDAGATSLKVVINDGGKSLISVEDNGEGIQLTDMDLLLERYATSKIFAEQDLLDLKSYGFRGEALASIAEVSKATIISKTAYSEIGTKLSKMGEALSINHLPVGFDHGTVVMIQDLFYNVPTKLKSLKSAQTEFFYCYNFFVDVAMYHYDKEFYLLKNDKAVFDLPVADSLLERITQLYKKDWSKNLKAVEYKDESVEMFGFVSDASLTFGSGDNIKIFVDGRSITDEIIKRALMDAYVGQIAPGEYPFAVLMLSTQSGVVDVSVHPKKSELKFVDSQKIYQIVHTTVKRALGESKVGHVETSYSLNPGLQASQGFWEKGGMQGGVSSQQGVLPEQKYVGENEIMGNYKVVGQLWDSYIIIESEDGIFYVDQHALAERIAFEKMKKDLSLTLSSKERECFEILLQPLLVEMPAIVGIHKKMQEINDLGFDCSVFSENRLIVYAVPQIFMKYKIDLEHLFNHIFYLDAISFDHILDQIFATKAYNTSIKVGQKLSLLQMTQLVKEGFEEIEGMFACQHGRPFFVKSDKKDLDRFFDR